MIHDFTSHFCCAKRYSILRSPVQTFVFNFLKQSQRKKDLIFKSVWDREFDVSNGGLWLLFGLRIIK